MNIANMQQRLDALLATSDGRVRWKLLDSSALPVKQALLIVQEGIPSGMTEGHFFKQTARRLSMQKKELREWMEIGLIALGWQRPRTQTWQTSKYAIPLAILTAETGIEFLRRAKRQKSLWRRRKRICCFKKGRRHPGRKKKWR